MMTSRPGKKNSATRAIRPALAAKTGAPSRRRIVHAGVRGSGLAVNDAPRSKAGSRLIATHRLDETAPPETLGRERAIDGSQALGFRARPALRLRVQINHSGREGEALDMETAGSHGELSGDPLGRAFPVSDLELPVPWTRRHVDIETDDGSMPVPAWIGISICRACRREEGERNSPERPCDHGAGVRRDHFEDHDVSHPRGGRVPLDTRG